MKRDNPWMQLRTGHLGEIENALAQLRRSDLVQVEPLPDHRTVTEPEPARDPNRDGA